MTALLAFLLTHTSIAIAALGALATVLGIGWGNLRGAKRERDKQAVAEVAARDIKDQVQNDVGALPADAVRKELGTWSRD
ncbi:MULTISPECIES: ABC transporter permease [unclassified Mesorhizobium]|uniref:ABC transporter permease n=1 Tax=unclassified Mesorhizobium TaxID=325217 RepID=UPI00112D3C4E|nr:MULTISPECIES: ABC transporter permease [unclassified Mesorhizobium]TPJ38199.1 ABC transporter permease [Mesorhizobium sp. B2-6-6]MCA0000973.1 ABC transporter permease [Mesorhizobium sp. B264B2A]MCA0004722.1 ABC transporter permease [Mesorhizobium sp. B264B1B]MCA0019079.1 ABC transporter permease [Mesorhizobium sp. B264B1A]TPJ52551.1 ABC transporter permease [Mesorhizobium sp. B2-6-7]